MRWVLISHNAVWAHSPALATIKGGYHKLNWEQGWTDALYE
jgi:hypothetical protein